MRWCVIGEWEDGSISIYGPFADDRRASRAEEQVMGLAHIVWARVMPMTPAMSLREELAHVNTRAL